MGVVPTMIPSRIEVLPANTKKVKHHPENPRRGNLDLIRESIRANGFYGTVIVQESTGYILIGNHRRRAAVAEKVKDLRFEFVDVDDRVARRLLAVDNRSQDMAGYDDPALAVLLENIMAHDEDLQGSGYADEDYEELLKRLNEEPSPQEPAQPKEPKSNIPPAPEDEKASTIRQVQLFLNDSTLPVFMRALERVKARFGVDNITDGVFRAVCHCAEEE